MQHGHTSFTLQSISIAALSLASTAYIAASEDVFSQQTARDGFDETVPLFSHLEFVGLSFVFPLGFLWLWVSFLSTSSG